MSDKITIVDDSNPGAWTIAGDVEAHNQAPDFEMPPLGMYTWELTGKSEDMAQSAKYDKTGTKKRTQFYFTLVDDEDWEGFVVKQFLNLSLNEKSHFRPFVEALIGRELGAKERVGWFDGDYRDPITGELFPIVGIGNRRLQAVLREDKKEDGRVYGRLDSPIPIQQRRGRRAAAPEEPVEAAEKTPPPF